MAAASVESDLLNLLRKKVQPLSQDYILKEFSNLPELEVKEALIQLLDAGLVALTLDWKVKLKPTGTHTTTNR